MGNVIFEYKNISKSFFGINALQNVSFQLEEGKILGLIGENGAGKSTLMNIMGGVLPPNGGEMILRGELYEPQNPADASLAGIEFIHQELNLFNNLSVAENIAINRFPLLGKSPFINKKQLIGETARLLESLNMEFAPGTLVEALSPGERQLVEIAKALSTDADILLFDEPTTSLTAKETENLFAILRRLQADGKSIIYISHILGDVQELADEVVILRDGQVMGGGPIADFPINKMINLMVGREIENIFPAKTAIPTDQIVLDVREVGEPGLVRDISLRVNRGEIVGMFGLMGAGRTEFARMVFGVDPYSEGTILLDGEELPRQDPQRSISEGIAFVTENRREEGLLMNYPIIENLSLVSLPDYTAPVTKIIDTGRLRLKAEEVTASLRLKAADIRTQPAKSLSGGNQQKVVIGKWLLKDPKLLIMDEPTRGIDVGAKYEVYLIMNQLAERGSGVLFISSEVEELMGVCDRIIVWSRGEIMGEFNRDEFSQESIMRAAFRQGIESEVGSEVVE